MASTFYGDLIDTGINCRQEGIEYVQYLVKVAASFIPQLHCVAFAAYTVIQENNTRTIRRKWSHIDLPRMNWKRLRAPTVPLTRAKTVYTQ
jgi:hypothetical protein